MPAYAETYLMDAMDNLGEMTQFVADDLHMRLDEFWPLFLASGYAEEFGHGSPRVVAGLSGTELALRVSESCGVHVPADAPWTTAESLRAIDAGKRSFQWLPGCDYWCGWALAYYQWRSGTSFRNIWRTVKMIDLSRMYATFHEESEERVAEALADMEAQRATSRLRACRQARGLSQSQLARLSGVGLRAIQQYEQGAKNINRAALENVCALAAALGCSTEDLLQPGMRIEYGTVDLCGMAIVSEH